MEFVFSFEHSFDIFAASSESDISSVKIAIK